MVWSTSSLNPSNWHRPRWLSSSSSTPSSPVPSSVFSNSSANSSTSSVASSIHWPDGTDGDPLDPSAIEDQGFEDEKPWEELADLHVSVLNDKRAQKKLDPLDSTQTAEARGRIIARKARKHQKLSASGYDPDYKSALTGTGLNLEAADTYRKVGTVYEGLGLPLPEEKRQSIVRGGLAKTHAEKLSGVRMSDWQDSAKAAPPWYATELDFEEQQSPGCHGAALRWLREKDKSDGRTRTDEQRTEEYNKTRYHRFFTDDLPNERIRQEYKEASKLPTLTSEALDFSNLSAEDKKLVTGLTMELDERKQRGDTMESIYAYAESYCRKHRKRPEWVPSEDGQSFNIDPSALETYGKVTGKLGDGTEVTFEQIKVDPAPEPTETRVCTTGPNPYYTTGYQAEVDKLNYSTYETLRKEYNDKIKKTREEASRRMEEATRLTPLSLPSVDTPPASFGKWVHGDNAPTDDGARSVALARAHAAHTVASAVSDVCKISYEKASRLGEWLTDSLGKSVSPSRNPQEIALDEAKIKQMKTETESYLQKAGAPSSVNFDTTIFPVVVSAAFEGKSFGGLKAWDERDEAEWLKRPGQSTAEPYSDAGQLARMIQEHDLMSALSRLNDKLSLDQITRMATYMSDLGPDSQKVSAFLQAAMKQLSVDPVWKLSKNDDRWKSHLPASTASATSTSADSSTTGGTSSGPST